MWTIKDSEIEESIRNKLHPTSVFEFQYEHYYLFHTQFDIYTCGIGRVTVNPLAIAKCDSFSGLNLKNDYYLHFVRSDNRLPGPAFDILKECISKHLYDISKAVNEYGLENVISYLDNQVVLFNKQEKEIEL